MLWCKWPWPQLSLRTSLSRNQAGERGAMCSPHLGGTDRWPPSVLQCPQLWPFKAQRLGGDPQERAGEGGGAKDLPKGHFHSLALCIHQLSGPQKPFRISCLGNGGKAFWEKWTLKQGNCPVYPVGGESWIRTAFSGSMYMQGKACLQREISRLGICSAMI